MFPIHLTHCVCCVSNFFLLQLIVIAHFFPFRCFYLVSNTSISVEEACLLSQPHVLSHMSQVSVIRDT
jgi:hypothetical protein